MNSKKRVLVALNKGKPDKVPIVETIDEPIQVKLAQLLELDIAGNRRTFQSSSFNLPGG